MKSYRKFTTVGEQRAKQQDRKQTIGCFLILIVACVLLAGLLYLLSPSGALLGSTALCGVSYRQLMLIVMFVTTILFIVIGALAANKGAPLSYYLKTLGWSIALGIFLHSIGISLLLHTNRWLADDTPVRAEYRVTEVHFQRPNRGARYHVFMPQCRVLQAERIGSPGERLYFHVPIDAQVAVDCTLHVTIRNGIFGWKQVDGLVVDCRELDRYIKQ